MSSPDFGIMGYHGEYSPVSNQDHQDFDLFTAPRINSRDMPEGRRKLRATLALGITLLAGCGPASDNSAEPIRIEQPCALSPEDQAFDYKVEEVDGFGEVYVGYDAKYEDGSIAMILRAVTSTPAGNAWVQSYEVKVDKREPLYSSQTVPITRGAPGETQLCRRIYPVTHVGFPPNFTPDTVRTVEKNSIHFGVGYDFEKMRPGFRVDTMFTPSTHTVVVTASGKGNLDDSIGNVSKP
ncbi:MAG: hypothetical protein M3Q44_08090 [bacterium]|nr:hypothetical protein [bacterium]